MKKQFFILAALAVSLISHAERTYDSKAIEGYNRISAIYSLGFSTPITNNDKRDIHTHHGMGLSYVRGIGLSHKLPFYLEAGLTWQYFPEKKGFELMRFSVPVNITYRFTLGKDGNFKISPFTGINLGINAVRELDWSYYDFTGPYVHDFDSHERVFQIGWMVGANFTYKGYNVGIAYCLDLNSLSKTTHGWSSLGRPYGFECKTRNLQISVGYEF